MENVEKIFNEYYVAWTRTKNKIIKEFKGDMLDSELIIGNLKVLDYANGQLQLLEEMAFDLNITLRK